MKAKTPFILLLILLLHACGKHFVSGGKESLVVEGWIASGEMPVVMLTTSATLTTEPQRISDMGDHVVTTARVSISDGEGEAVMMARYDKRYPTGMVYTTGRITGQPGKTYTLKVDYLDYHVSAVTMVPQNPSGLSLDVVYSEEGQNTVLASFDVPEGDTYYKLFAKEDPDAAFIPCFLGTFKGRDLKHLAKVPVYPGKSLGESSSFRSFSKGSRAIVRLCTMDETSWVYWKAFDEVSSMSLSPVFAVRYNLPGNVDGALGYWAGYGIADAEVVIE